MNTKQEISAGGVVVKTEGEAILVLIAKHSGYHKWVLPKGLVEAGEKLEDTAVREVTEETGIKAKIISPLGEPESYVYTLEDTRVFKKVYYFLMEYVAGDIQTHDFEMEAVEWVTFDEAMKRLGFSGAKQVLKQAKLKLEDR